MDEITELERRMTAALERIGVGLDAIVAKAPTGSQATASGPASGPAAGDDDVAGLAAALEAERSANAQLNERVRAIRERQETTVATLERRIEQMTRQLDTQGIELSRMKKANIGLRESLRGLRGAQEGGITDAHLINKSMLAELEALRASRTAEMAEMAEILDELAPLIGGGTHA